MPATNKSNPAAWIALGILILVLLGVIFFAPEVLPEYKLRLLAIVTAILCGISGSIFAGNLQLDIKALKTKFGDAGLKATSGFAIFALVLFWWFGPLAPIQTAEARAKDVAGALEVGSATAGTAGDQSVVAEVPKPSAKAIQLASQIPDDANAYARAMKLITEGRYDEARPLLDEAQQKKLASDTALTLVRARLELYSGNAAKSLPYYAEALKLKPNNAQVIGEAALARQQTGDLKGAESLYKQSLLVPANPNKGRTLNNLALLKAQEGNIDSAVILQNQALKTPDSSQTKVHSENLAKFTNIQRVRLALPTDSAAAKPKAHVIARQPITNKALIHHP